MPTHQKHRQTRIPLQVPSPNGSMPKFSKPLENVKPAYSPHNRHGCPCQAHQRPHNPQSLPEPPCTSLPQPESSSLAQEGRGLQRPSWQSIHFWTIYLCPSTSYHLPLSLPPFSAHVSPPLTHAPSDSAKVWSWHLQRARPVCVTGWTPLSCPIAGVRTHCQTPECLCLGPARPLHRAGWGSASTGLASQKVSCSHQLWAEPLGQVLGSRKRGLPLLPIPAPTGCSPHEHPAPS